MSDAARGREGATLPRAIRLLSVSTVQNIEPLEDEPAFLSLTGFRVGEGLQEIASRRRLDTRQVVPFFDHGGVRHIGVLERSRASRRVRGADPVSLEPIGFDFSGVDETGDILSYGRAIFTARAGVEIDGDGAPVPLPSVARSMGWSTELAMPLLVPIRPPASSAIEVSWDGGHHRIVFHPGETLATLLRTRVAAEDLALALPVLRPPKRRTFTGDAVVEGAWDRERLARAVRAPIDVTFDRVAGLRGKDLRFLHVHRVRENDHWFEIVTPREGVTAAVMPYVVSAGEPYFLLWVETRVTALERRERQPIFDLPVHPRHINATARYVAVSDLQKPPQVLAAEVLRAGFGRDVEVLSAEVLGTAEPVPSFGNEVRTRILCQLAPLRELPPDIVMISATELAAAIGEGVVRDPVIVATLLDLGFNPFAEEAPQTRRAFIDRMTEGSVVQRRLQSYSSIEAEQLGSKTYARLMLLLQHEYGVRIAYPHSEADRSFFKAAFRVFMAAPRGDENRALQGLHWSHDAFHFALGNYTLPANQDFAEWYLSGAPLPEPLPPEGETYEAYVRALKAAEDEATFFSFFTIYEEQPSLKQHVKQLTYWEALGRMELKEHARAIFDDVTHRAVLPPMVAEHPLYDGEIKGLFEYMLGFRDYHLKDINDAWKHASRDMYRGFFVRFGVYESDSDRYVASVRSFMDRLASQPPGLDPLRALAADVRVSIALRVFDVTKSLRLQRKTCPPRALDRATSYLTTLDDLHRGLEALRAEIHDAELSPANERRYGSLNTVATDVEALRQRIWTEAELPADVLATERTRELPR
jgi:hypothetical protein